VSNVILELLAITQWGSLDDLIIDLPPGIGDEVLDVVRYMPRSWFLVVTTPSELAWAAVEKLLDILQELKRPLLGVVENMVTTPSHTIQGRVQARGLQYLGELPYDGGVEAALGKADDLPTTHFGMALSNLLQKLPSRRA
jgi:ATP-binding protein involved in chromosome partitioning